MQRFRTAHGAGRARSVLAPTILLFCTGWILNFTGVAVGAPVIERGGGASGGGSTADDNSNTKIHNQPIIPLLDNFNNQDDDYHTRNDHDRVTMMSSTTTGLTENVDNTNSGDTIKTENEHSGEGEGALPVIVIPDNVLGHVDNPVPNNETEIVQDVSGENQKNVVVVLEYQPNLVIRCAAKGSSKANVTWEYDGGVSSPHLPHFVVTNSLTYGHGYIHSNGDGDDDTVEELQNGGGGDGNQGGDESWVDLKLPKLNNAFYGKLRCRAENQFGNATWEIELIHNANSSMLMKVVRCALAILFLLIAIFVVKVVLWADKKRRDKLYARLPPQDLEIINKFKKGLEPPPPSPCSSIMVAERKMSLLEGATSCVKGIEVSMSGDKGETSAGSAMRDGYRPVKHDLSTPELHKRLLNGGASTPSTCSSGHVLDAVNSWTNYVPYNDKMETSSQHFSVDITKIIENGCYGKVYAGQVRNDLTMEWSSVAVKSGKVDNGKDDSYVLEAILTELKILASLPKPHDSIVNLKGAYTKMLHKRQALVFVDYCDNGTLANFIDLNHGNFRNIFMDSSVDGNSLRMEESANSTPTIPASTSIQSSSGSNGITFMAKPQDDKMEPQKEQQFVSHKELIAWAWQIAEGMNFLHKNRVVHGNLSTANIYLTSQFKVKIGNIGHPPTLEEAMQCSDDEQSKKWLSVPQYCYEQFSKRSDIWDFGRLIWEMFSLREQECPDNGMIVNFMRNNDEGNDDVDDADDIDIPQYATPEIFELMLCCWNENVTLCPEFDFFVKSYKKLYKEVIVITTGAKDKSQQN